MHFVDVKGILTGHGGYYGMNIYRGCTHGCIYCDSRSRCYQFKHPFEDIEVKQNAPELLDAALKSKKKKCMTLTTYDDDLCRILEPNVCNTKRRIEVLEEMQKRGIPTVVWLTPILPFINDTEDNITAILNECVRVGVKGIIDFGMGLTLREGDREYYYAALDRHFPGMKERYIKRYGNAYELPSPDAKELMGLLHKICKDNGILSSPDECFGFIRELPDKYPQMSIFDL